MTLPWYLPWYLPWVWYGRRGQYYWAKPLCMHQSLRIVTRMEHADAPTALPPFPHAAAADPPAPVRPARGVKFWYDSKAAPESAWLSARAGARVAGHVSAGCGAWRGRELGEQVLS